jgi:hypothetical protein
MGRANLVNGRRRSLKKRFGERRYTPATLRIGLACALCAAIGMVELGSTSGADTSFVPGNARAQAQSISVAPTTGGLNYAITLATSIADFQDVEAQSLSQTVDLGAIGTSLEAQGCSGGPPTLPSSDVPPPEQAESTNGNQSLTTSITPQSSPAGFGIGNESASATTQPASDATTTASNISVPGGLLTLNGLTSSSHASIDQGTTRTATATADVGQISIGNGAVVLGGLHWAATQQSGGATTSSATFSINSLTVAGVPVDLSQLSSAASLQSVLNIVNTALSPLGLNIQWPATSTLNDGTVVISPLTIGIDNNTLGQEVVGSNLGSIQPERAALVNALLSANCNFANAILVSDIGVGVLAGGGNLNVSFGGASAMTNDLAFTSPFGPGASAPALPATPSTTASAVTGNSGSTTGTTGLPFTGGSGTTLPAPLPSAASTTPASAGPQPVALGPMVKTSDCISLGPSGGGCNTGNVAVPIGLASLGLLTALFTGDYLRQRRRLRLGGGAEGAS